MSSLQPGLAAAQAWLQAALIASERPPVAELKEHLIGTATFPAAAGVGVYRRAFVARIAAAMRAQFPALCHVLGRPLFDGFSEDYVRRYPPQSYTLYDLGRRFEAFLQEERPDRDQPADAREAWIDFMIELARFERQLFVMFDAPGSEGGCLAGPDAPDERLRLQPAVALSRFRFTVADIYHAVQRGEEPPPPRPGRFCLAMVRKDYVVRTIALSDGEFALLRHMALGHSLADAVSATAGPREDPAFRATLNEARRRWLDWGLFVDTAPPPTSPAAVTGCGENSSRAPTAP